MWYPTSTSLTSTLLEFKAILIETKDSNFLVASLTSSPAHNAVTPELLKDAGTPITMHFCTSLELRSATLLLRPLPLQVLRGTPGSRAHAPGPQLPGRAPAGRPRAPAPPRPRAPGHPARADPGPAPGPTPPRRARPALRLRLPSPPRPLEPTSGGGGPRTRFPQTRGRVEEEAPEPRVLLRRCRAPPALADQPRRLLGLAEPRGGKGGGGCVEAAGARAEAARPAAAAALLCGPGRGRRSGRRGELGVPLPPRLMATTLGTSGTLRPWRPRRRLLGPQPRPLW
ncbi:translation initiation factor IF-2-like [Camelus ferus]|uniref:Translation initiation factor IF-2-like n=1 Tax=Camelus ferus TaxID=419612 RepID=A0A8B8UK36_CAMFR|nr:translation initiation factor IF-2-like [Camelus ferus]